MQPQFKIMFMYVINKKFPKTITHVAIRVHLRFLIIFNFGVLLFSHKLRAKMVDIEAFNLNEDFV